MLGERCRFVARNDDVIEHAHVHQTQRFLEPLGQRPVSRARLGVSARMVVRNDDRRRIEPQRLLTTSRGYTDAPSIVPWNISLYSIRRWRVSMNSTTNTSCSKLANFVRKYSLTAAGEVNSAPRRIFRSMTWRAASRMSSADAGR